WMSNCALLPIHILFLPFATKAKVFSQCKLSHMLQKEDTTGATASPTVSFTQSIKANGSANYDVFKISSQLWCTDDHSPLDNGCRVACRDMLSSNITDDIICAKRIVRNP
uniref:lysozyme n=1 Tax=Athene cunicularia TaxID=194338 RepID=A0A663LYB1_ATHCN